MALVRIRMTRGTYTVYIVKVLTFTGKIHVLIQTEKNILIPIFNVVEALFNSK